MCNFASFVLSKDKEFWSEKTDSHTEIIQEHGLYEYGVHGPNLLKVELVPPREGRFLFDLKSWHYQVDQDIKPEWITGEEEHRTKSAFLRRFPMLIKHQLITGGHLHLSGLTSLPANAKLSAGGNLNLSGLTSLPANAKLSAGGNLYLSGLTSLPANAKLSAGRYLNLRGLTSLPANAKLSVGVDLDLSGLISLPANAKLSAGGNLYLPKILKDKQLPVSVKSKTVYYT